MKPRVAPLGEVYGREHVPLPTAAEAAEADRQAREDHQVPARVLMENAGRTAALILHRLHPRGRIVGVAGSGNNGGDLLVMLRTLQAWGRDARVIAAGSQRPEALLAHGFDVALSAADAEAEAWLAVADVIVDGMLGTGSSGAPRGRIAEWIARINASGRPVLALDLPSGVDASTGRVTGEAVRAQTTVTFGWPKLGLLLQPARGCCGRLIAVEIGFPPPVMAGATAALITPQWALRRQQPRPAAAHKGTAGRLLVMGGSEGMAGAAAIAAEAALRAGAGLIRVASSAANRDILQTGVPEATFIDRRRLTAEDVAPMHAAVLGPGMGQDAEARDALERALQLLGDRPLVLDADALNLLSAQQGALAAVAARRPVVITPHPGELSRLTGADPEQIVADAPAAARAAAADFGCVVLLKGQPSLVATPSGALLVAALGSSDLATAGMGDQLAGVIGALLSGGADPVAAAGVGLFLSARAADLCARGRSLSPRDVSAQLATAMTAPFAMESDIGFPFITFDQPPRW